jgi:hypothetical protein
MQRFQNGLHNGIGLRKHIAVTEAKDAKAVRSEERVALLVVRRLRHMLAAVEFDDNGSFQTDEITDIATNRALPAKLEAVHLAAA